MSEHSRGEWLQVGRRVKAIIDGTDMTLAVANLNIVPVDYGVTGPNHPEAIANARLMATAPELLDVLKHIQDQIIYLQESYGTDGFPEIIARRVREVIARAEGANH